MTRLHVRYDHPDLSTYLLPGYDFVSDVAAANDQARLKPLPMQ